MNYYNEFDPAVAQWLRNLISAGLIPPGDVDERSIEDVTPAELSGYTQCHFFAGIGGWPLALAIAGWPVDRPVWTGSCPCQPFSAAGKGAGFEDERHLWPAWQHLVAQCGPAVVFGEQVASKAAEPWIDLVQADLEGLGYAFGCVPIPAAGVGAPHIRDRTFWVAHASGSGLQKQRRERNEPARPSSPNLAGRMADANGRNASTEWQQRSGEQRQQSANCCAGGLADTDGGACGQRRSVNGWRNSGGNAESRPGLSCSGVFDGGRPGPLDGFWSGADWICCTDGKWRPVEPGTFPLAHGVPSRVVRLRAYGNAIVPQVAAEFIAAYLDVTQQARVAA